MFEMTWPSRANVLGVIDWISPIIYPITFHLPSITHPPRVISLVTLFAFATVSPPLLASDPPYCRCPPSHLRCPFSPPLMRPPPFHPPRRLPRLSHPYFFLILRCFLFFTIEELPSCITTFLAWPFRCSLHMLDLEMLDLGELDNDTTVVKRGDKDSVITEIANEDAIIGGG
ncbi:hypothetical protein BHE74_00001872 [Ensete ventricosum]|nr:hypothetical protein BHE74_00001872 [Ensete ventricosum]